jgi:Polysaccharide deacetylase
LTLDREQKRREILESREKIESQLGVTVRGFRAPGYRIDRESWQLLAESGYEYDASAFPTDVFARRLECPVERLQSPHRPLPGRALVELPLPDHRPFPVPFSPSYALVIGDWYFRWGLERFRRRPAPLVLLFHLIDMAEPMQPKYLNGWRSRVFTLSNLTSRKKIDRCQKMLDAVRRNYRLTSTAGLLEECRSALAGEGPGPYLAEAFEDSVGSEERP